MTARLRATLGAAGASVTQNEIGDDSTPRATAMAPWLLIGYRPPSFSRWSRANPAIPDGGVFAGSRDRIAMTLRQQGDSAGALALYEEGLAATDKAAATHPEDASAQRDLATALEHVGDLLQARGNPAGAAKIYTREAEVARALAARAPDNPNGNAPWLLRKAA